LLDLEDTTMVDSRANKVPDKIPYLTVVGPYFTTMVELWPIYKGLELVSARSFRIIGITYDSQVAKSLIMKNLPLEILVMV